MSFYAGWSVANNNVHAKHAGRYINHLLMNIILIDTAIALMIRCGVYMLLLCDVQAQGL